MSDDLCPHFFSDPAFCADCTPRKKDPEPERSATPHSIKAEFEGRCTECKERIEVGDEIVPDLRFGWDHAECV